jgi:phage tail sheath gpL-like
MDRLYRLDAIITPGVARAEFVGLFAECTICGLVMSRRAFQSHECVMPERDTNVVELTGEGDE